MNLPNRLWFEPWIILVDHVLSSKNDFVHRTMEPWFDLRYVGRAVVMYFKSLGKVANLWTLLRSVVGLCDDSYNFQNIGFISFFGEYSVIRITYVFII